MKLGMMDKVIYPENTISEALNISNIQNKNAATNWGGY